MSGLMLAIVISLIICFVIICTDCLLNRPLSYIFVPAESGDDNIEAKIRIILNENPTCEIIVIDGSNSAETNAILEKISVDFLQVHIIKSTSAIS